MLAPLSQQTGENAPLAKLLFKKNCSLNMNVGMSTQVSDHCPLAMFLFLHKKKHML